MIENIYVHIPFCDGKCAYCAFFSERPGAHSLFEYPDKPAAELKSLVAAGMIDLEEISPRTLYFGGGTPSLLGAEGLRRLFESLQRVLPLDNFVEFTVEVNPADASPVLFSACREIGVTRISIGVQSFSDPVLRLVGRRHDAQRARQAIEWALGSGIADVGIDLIVGLPHWRESGEWRAERGEGRVCPQWMGTDPTVDDLFDNLCHVSVYSLILEPGTLLAKWVDSGEVLLPTEDETQREFKAMSAFLAEHGFQRYEISNWSRPGHVCRHNMGTWQGEDYLGLGPGASSRVGRRRWDNAKNIAEAGAGQTRTVMELSPREDALERLIFRLRTSDGLNWRRDIESNSEFAPFASRWLEILRFNEEKGLVRFSQGNCSLTSAGFDLCDAILSELYSAV